MAKKDSLYYRRTGNMGWAAVQEMLKKPSEINIKMLARKARRTRRSSKA